MSNPSSPPAAYYRQVGPDRFCSTVHAQGAWSPDQQHMAPVSGLLTHVLENCSPRGDLVMSKVGFDILGLIPAGNVEVSARVVRQGRTIELVEAEMSAGGRPVVRATAWRLAVSDTSSIAATDLGRIEGPDAATAFDMAAIWPGGYIQSLEARMIGSVVPGRSTVWLRPLVELVDGQPTSAVARIIGMVDTANGVAVRAHPREVMFPNTDLTVHLFRVPTGDWLGLQTDVSFGSAGIGLTSSVLHDVEGPLGRSAQTLTLRIPR